MCKGYTPFSRLREIMKLYYIINISLLKNGMILYSKYFYVVLFCKNVYGRLIIPLMFENHHN